ncbi:MAG: hypothetical protein FWC39_03950 [Bacteroidetes bacterium]|nr:hypothetical protein [Bacteroidota bacterium]
MVQDTNEIHGEVATAIAMALYLYKMEFAHNKLPFKPTLQRVFNSPWSSKVLTLRQNPRQ